MARHQLCIIIIIIIVWSQSASMSRVLSPLVGCNRSKFNSHSCSVDIGDCCRTPTWRERFRSPAVEKRCDIWRTRCRQGPASEEIWASCWNRMPRPPLGFSCFPVEPWCRPHFPLVAFPSSSARRRFPPANRALIKWTTTACFNHNNTAVLWQKEASDKKWKINFYFCYGK